MSECPSASERNGIDVYIHTRARRAWRAGAGLNVQGCKGAQRVQDRRRELERASQSAWVPFSQHLPAFASIHPALAGAPSASQCSQCSHDCSRPRLERPVQPACVSAMPWLKASEWASILASPMGCRLGWSLVFVCTVLLLAVQRAALGRMGRPVRAAGDWDGIRHGGHGRRALSCASCERLDTGVQGSWPAAQAAGHGRARGNRTMRWRLWQTSATLVPCASW